MSRKQEQRLPPWQQIGDSCRRALYGWPLFHIWTGKAVVPCVGFIESDYDPGMFSPCADCNPKWCRVPTPNVAPPAPTYPLPIGGGFF